MRKKQFPFADETLKEHQLGAIGLENRNLT